MGERRPIRSLKLGSILLGLLLLGLQLSADVGIGVGIGIGVGALSPRELRLEGSTTVLPIAARAAELFQVLYPEIFVTIKGGGSSVGIAALINGTTDIATASRAMKPTERERLPTAVEWVIAKDGIAIVVHPSNPVERVTFAQIAEIYTNPRVRNWKDFGGPDLPIVVVSRDTTSGTYGSFMDMVIEEVKGKGARLRPDVIYVGSNAEMVATIEEAEGAIGYIGVGYLRPTVKVLPVSADGVTYVTASVETVLDGSYPISRSLYMYTDGVPLQEEPRGLFIDFIYSRTGQCVVLEQGFVPLYPIEEAVAPCRTLFEALGTEFIERE